MDVRVVTGVLHGHEDEPRRAVQNGVEIVRVPSTSFERSKICGSGLELPHLPRQRAVERPARTAPGRRAVHDRPADHRATSRSLVARRYRVPLVVISQDVFPEIAVQLKRLENRAVMSVLRGLVSLYLRRADRIVAIGDTMRLRLEEKGAPPEPGARDSELGRHEAARAFRRRERMGQGGRSRQEVRRHAQRQRRPCTGSRLAGPRRRRSCAISTT